MVDIATQSQQSPHSIICSAKSAKKKLISITLVMIAGLISPFCVSIDDIL